MENEKQVKFTEKKIDDSWKDSIQEEKQKLSGSKDSPLPPISFVEFLTSLGMQTLIHLGEVEHPATKKKEKNLDAARETIDILALLKEKTKGNLTEQESSLLTNLIADLQLRYVEAIR